jgi:hypothetical protein
VATLAHKIDDRPAVLTALEMVETEVGEFSSSEATTEEHRNNCSVALAFEGFHIGEKAEMFSGFCATSYRVGSR